MIYRIAGYFRTAQNSDCEILKPAKILTRSKFTSYRPCCVHDVDQILGQVPRVSSPSSYLSPISCSHVSTSPIVASHTRLCRLYMVSSHNRGCSLFALFSHNIVHLLELNCNGNEFNWELNFAPTAFRKNDTKFFNANVYYR